MEKEILLNNGVKIPTPGFGTFLTPDGETCVKAVKSAIAAGYTHIDTAAVYKNEKSVGEGIKESGIKRENLFVTSKVWNTERGYDKTLKAFDKTLNDLGLDSQHRSFQLHAASCRASNGEGKHLSDG